jgi:hypothetical protein
MEFPSNSHKAVEGPKPELPKKDIQKVVTGDAIQRQKPLRRKFKELFFGGEFKGATRYITVEVLLPAVKNMVVDATTKGIERIIYGDSSPRRRTEIGRPRISYNNPIDRYSRQRAMLPDQPPYSAARGRREDVGEIILVSRDEANLVVERLTDIIDKYGVASVADLHDLVGLPTTHVENKWGWSALKYAEVRQIREGYLIDLPAVEPI